MKVKNGKTVRNLALKNMKRAKLRNIISVAAIALTAILFTAFFTIFMSIIDSIEYSNFRMVGTMSHGEFKRLTLEQYEELRDDPDIKEYGIRRIIGIASDSRFDKKYAEVSYMSKNTAEWSFIRLAEGSLPEEGTNQAAMDSDVLTAMGIERKIGTEFTLEMDVDGIPTAETLTLCGWWEYDPVSPANHILLAESKAEELFVKLNTQFYDEFTGKYNLDVMLKSSYNIENQLYDILSRHGFSIDSNEENSIKVGINWGYLSENSNISLDAETIAIIALIIVLIIFTGYLIIYNIFRISVANDIRYYGMLKTIGTTGRQIRSLIRFQALLLSAAGIPVGLFIGWFIGAVLTPVVMNELNVYSIAPSLNPVIFIFSALFALFTVLISCHIPAAVAAKVSPIAALRYTEGSGGCAVRTTKGGASIPAMAMANLSRSKGRTILTVISLTLPLVIFCLTISFTNSFSMEKYLSDITNDFVVSDSSYFNVMDEWNESKAITEEEIEMLRNMEGVTDSFVSYGISLEDNKAIEAYYPPETVREIFLSYGNDPESVERIISNSPVRDGKISSTVLVMGVEQGFFDKAHSIFEGDVSKLSEEGYIAVEKSDNFKLGDKVILEYTDHSEWVNEKTGAVYGTFDEIPVGEYEFIALRKETHICEYEVAAIIDSAYGLGYGFSLGSDLFFLDNKLFLREVPYAAPLYVALNTEDEAEAEIEEFLSSYIENTTLDYSSKAKAIAEFEDFKRMFLILGSVLSLIIGLVGMLNFSNTILTGIIARKHEHAILRSIGMTGKQLKAMLICEGLLYTMSSAAAAALLNLLTIPIAPALENIFWFCEYEFSLLPLLVMLPVFAAIGIILPLITYRLASRKSIVEQLREYE